MARNFGGVSDRLHVATPAATAVPLTVSAWMNCDTIAATGTIFSLREDATGHFFELRAAGGVGGDPIQWRISGSAAMVAATTSGYSADVWNHVCGISASSTDHRVFLNGGSKGTDATNTTPNAPTYTEVGALSSAGSSPFDGDICEVAAWNVALSDAEVAILALGYSPLFVQPANLIAYWPIIGRNDPEQDLIGGLGLSDVVSASASPHTRVIYPGVRRAA